jgi:glucan biosynthesis protein
MTSRTDPDALALFQDLPDDLGAAGWRLSEQYSVGYPENDTHQRSQYASYVRAGEGAEMYGESDGPHWQELRDELFEQMRLRSNL